MRKRLPIIITACAAAVAILPAPPATAQVPHTILAMVRQNMDEVPPSEQIKFLAYLKDMSDGGVQSETRTDDDTGNAYGDGVMGDGWLELECANFTQFDWADGDSLRLAIVDTEADQLFTTSIALNAAVEPQLEETIYLRPFLTNFHGSGSVGQIMVEWFLAPEVDPVDFYIYRSTAEEGPYQRLSDDPCQPQEANYYRYCDDSVTDGLTYYYQLGLAEFSDSVALFGPVAASTRTAVSQESNFSGPDQFRLSQNYPNPFNPQTTIDYQVARTAAITLVIYNLLGQQVRTLVDETQMPGYYQVTWDGRDEWNDRVASGVYFYRLVAGSYAETKKMTLLK